MKVFHGSFSKYQATGNDFVMVDDRNLEFPAEDKEQIAKICHRRFGIGADGLILIQADPQADFRMVYFNSDGAEGSLCGNGARCAVAFAATLGLTQDPCRFMAIDGIHEARLGDGVIHLQMSDVEELRPKERYTFLNTGSPHHVQEVEELEALDVSEEGRRLRYGLYGPSGSNINFAQVKGNGEVQMRTYERGVEDETYSCGTGVTAVALALHQKGRLQGNNVRVSMKGGELSVRFSPDDHGGYRNIWLSGPAEKVFEGTFT